MLKHPTHDGYYPKPKMMLLRKTEKRRCLMRVRVFGLAIVAQAKF